MPKGHKGQGSDIRRQLHTLKRQMAETDRRVDDLEERLEPVADHVAATEREVIDLAARVTRLERPARQR